MKHIKPKHPSFFKTRGRLISFIGAVIVFGTFIIKDNLKENWRATADAVHTAKYFYTVRQDIRREQTHYQDVRERLDRIYERLTPPDPDNRDALFDDLKIEDQILNSSAADLDNAQILLGRLPVADSRQLNVDGLQQQIAGRLQLSDDASISAGPQERPEDTPFVKAMRAEADIKNKARLERLRTGTSEIQEYTNARVKEILGKATEVEERDEKYSTYAGWCSTALYTLGGGLGLAGRLFGGGELMPTD